MPAWCGPGPPQPQREFIVRSERLQLQSWLGPLHAHSIEHPQSWASGWYRTATMASEPWTAIKAMVARATGMNLSIIILFLRLAQLINYLFITLVGPMCKCSGRGGRRPLASAMGESRSAALELF